MIPDYCNTLYTESSIATFGPRELGGNLMKLQHSLYRVVYCYFSIDTAGWTAFSIATLSIPSRLLLRKPSARVPALFEHCNTLYTESSIATKTDGGAGGALTLLQHSLYRVVYCYQMWIWSSIQPERIATLSIPSRLLLRELTS